MISEDGCGFGIRMTLSGGECLHESSLQLRDEVRIESDCLRCRMVTHSKEFKASFYQDVHHVPASQTHKPLVLEGSVNSARAQSILWPSF